MTRSVSADTHVLPSITALAISQRVQRIVLAGFMGSGKSTIGRLLANGLGWSFLDLDSHLEQRTGVPIPKLFSEYGEARFRQLESAALASALGHRLTVLALGGGTPEILTNRLLLEQTPGTFIIFLSAPFETLFDRCMLQAMDRPVLADIDQARARFLARQPAYRRLACLTLHTELQSPEETAAAILLALE